MWHTHTHTSTQKISGDPLQGLHLNANFEGWKVQVCNWRDAHFVWAPLWLTSRAVWPKAVGGWVGGWGEVGVGLGCSPWTTTLLPFPVHQWQLPWGNSRYQMFGHLVTVVRCQIQQIRPHLAAHGWQIIGNGCGWKCCTCTAAGHWQDGPEEGGQTINKSVADC